jgi:hypothetical protein
LTSEGAVLQGRVSGSARAGDAGLDLEALVVSVAAALAVSGLAELFLQRIVYRVGMHVPRQGLFLEAYRVATVSGDFAFKTTAVLLFLTASVAVAWLWQRRSRPVAFLLAALMVTNLMAWPLELRAGVALAPLVFAFGAVWVAGQAFAGRGLSLLALAAMVAALALALSQYRAGMTLLGDEPGHLPELQLVSEAGVLLTAALVTLAAARPRAPVPAVAVSALMTLALLASYAREPSTVAIVSLWATGVTMSLPGAVYVLAFGGVVFATLVWLRRADTRSLALGLVLLMVAGLQPQAVHHGVTALLGLTFLAFGPGAPRRTDPVTEVTHAT